MTDDDSERAETDGGPDLHDTTDAAGSDGASPTRDPRERASEDELRGRQFQWQGEAASVEGEQADAEGTPDADEFFVKRDEDDNPLPVWEEAGQYGEVKVLPMVYGQAERYFGDAGSVTMIGPSVVAEVLNNHILEPDLAAHARDAYGSDGLTERVVAEEMEPFGPMMLLQAVFTASGLSPDVAMDDAGNARIDFDADGAEQPTGGN